MHAEQFYLLMFKSGKAIQTSDLTLYLSTAAKA
jgi:hypothetical protein